MEEFPAFLILHKVVEVLLSFKFHKVDLVRLFDAMINEGLFPWSYAKQQSAVVFRNYRDSDSLKFVEDLFLAGHDVNKLRYIYHMFSGGRTFHAKQRVISSLIVFACSFVNIKPATLIKLHCLRVVFVHIDLIRL